MKFYSLSQYPGTTGKKFYEHFFKKYGLSNSYTPLACNLEQFEFQFRHLIEDEADGISVSMPFKNIVLKNLTELDISCKDYLSCNTVIVKNNRRTGYNTDIQGIYYVASFIQKMDRISILGQGALGKMFTKFFKTNHYHRTKVYSRHEGNFNDRHTPTDILINCTGIGTVNTDSPVEFIPKNTRLIVDLSLTENKLFQQCLDTEVQYIKGLDFYLRVFQKQFSLYAGIELSINEIEEDISLILL